MDLPAPLGSPIHTVAGAGQVLRTARDDATDLLIVYYAGHGLLDNAGRLYLALRETDVDRLDFTAIAIDTLKRDLSETKARARVLILDCCFSGRAIAAMSDPSSLATGQLLVNGTYTLASTTATTPSHAQPGSRNSSFTAALLDGFAQPFPLTLDGLFYHVDRQLSSAGLPRPQRQVTNTANRVALVRGPVDPGPTTLIRPGNKVGAMVVMMFALIAVILAAILPNLPSINSAGDNASTDTTTGEYAPPNNDDPTDASTAAETTTDPPTTDPTTAPPTPTTTEPDPISEVAHARAQLLSAGNTAADAVDKARDQAPPKPGWLSSLGTDIENFAANAWHGAENAGANFVNDIASYGNAAINHPGEVLAAFGGAALTVISGAGEVGGGALDATGFGAVAGVPLNIASAAGIATGVGITGTAMVAMAGQAAGEDHVEPVQTNSGSTSGATSEEPPFEAPKEISGRTDHGEQQIQTRDGHGVTDDAVANP